MDERRQYRPMDWVFALFDISLPTANKFYTWGWAASLGGAVITLIGVVLLMWGTRVRDHNFEGSIAHLHQSAAASEERSKELERGNLTLQGQVERERTERLWLEERLSPRQLASQQRAAFIHKMRSFSGSSLDIVVYPTGTSDIGPLQNVLTLALRDAGWIVRRWNMLNTEFVLGVGVAVRRNADSDTNLRANSLVAALNDAGILAARAPDLTDNSFPAPAAGPAPEGDIAPIRMYVGTKPL